MTTRTRIAAALAATAITLTATPAHAIELPPCSHETWQTCHTPTPSHHHRHHRRGHHR